MKFSKLMLVVGMGWLTVASGLALADEVPADIRKVIESAMERVSPDMPYGEISESPIKGVYQVVLDGSAFLYITADGEYFISGELYENSKDGLVNLSEAERKLERTALLKEISTGDMIIFPPAGETKAIINVFTDVDCGYCRKLHQEVPELNSKGIEVRYLAFPRSGPIGPSYEKIASAWCAENPQQALTDLKAGKRVETNVCEGNPVAMEFELGSRLGVRGTPSLFLMDGTLIPGYKPASDLIELLGLN